MSIEHRSGTVGTEQNREGDKRDKSTITVETYDSVALLRERLRSASVHDTMWMNGKCYTLRSVLWRNEQPTDVTITDGYATYRYTVDELYTEAEKYGGSE